MVGKDVRVVGDNYDRTTLAQDIARGIEQQVPADTHPRTHTLLQGDDSAFYVFDLSSLVDRFTVWQRCMQRARPYYAVKCNSDPLLVRTLAALGCGFDCASKAEIEAVRGMVDAREDIIYANPCKTKNYIRHATDVGVRMMTFDSEDEVKKIAQLAPDAQLIMRINVSDPTAQCRLSVKFGVDPDERADALLRVARTHNVAVVGISFHVGSGCRDATAFARAIEHARRLFDVGTAMGHQMTILDLGGGFPGDDDAKFERMAGIINSALDKHFPDSPDSVLAGVTIIAEPGRYFAAAAFSLQTTIMARTRCSAERITGDHADANTDGYMYYMNDGVYGSFNCIIYDHSVVNARVLFAKVSASNLCARAHSMQDAHADSTTCASLWGPTCDGLDLVVPSCRLPILDEGDWLAFDNMGAYTLSAGCEFNGFPRPAVNYFVRQKDVYVYAF
jgi:ornithine decarboxylase